MVLLLHDKKFMVTSVDSSTEITITMPSVEGDWRRPTGGIRVRSYYSVGPAGQLLIWLEFRTVGRYGIRRSTNKFKRRHNATTTIVLTDATLFPSSGTSFIQIGTEEIFYTGISGNTLTGVTRGLNNTAASHSNADTVTNSTDYVAWGESFWRFSYRSRYVVYR